MKCIKEIIYIEDSGRFDQNSVVTTHSHCDQFCFETSSVTVFIAATGYHFQLTVLTFQLTKKHHKPVIAFAGGIEKGAEACNKAGITAFFPAVRGVTTLDEAMRPETAAENLAESAEQVFRLLTLR